MLKAHSTNVKVQFKVRSYNTKTLRGMKHVKRNKRNHHLIKRNATTPYYKFNKNHTLNN